MNISRLYPICNKEKPKVFKEFLSGFFYFGRYRYIELPSEGKELKLQKDLKKNTCSKNALKVGLYATGIVPIIAGIYKLIETLSLSGKKITIIPNPEKPVEEKDPKGPEGQKVAEVVKPIVNPSKYVPKYPTVPIVEPIILDKLNLGDLAKSMTREEFENGLKDAPSIRTICLSRNAALKEYIWMPEVLKNKPEIKLDFIEDQEDLKIDFEKGTLEAMSFYVEKSLNFANIVFSSFVDALQENEEAKEVKGYFLELVCAWGQSADIDRYPNMQSEFINDLIFAISIADDNAAEVNKSSLENIISLVLAQGDSQQIIKLIESCLKSSVLSKYFLEKITSEQIKSIKIENQTKDFLQMKFCLLLERSKLYDISWVEQAEVLKKLSLSIPNFKKEDIQDKFHSKDISSEGLFNILTTINLLNIIQILDLNLNQEDKIKICKESFEFMKTIGKESHYVFYGKALAEVNLSEENIQIILKSMNSKGILSFLETILERDDVEEIQKTFKVFLPIHGQVHQNYPGPLALILEHINTPQKAIAIYKAYPQENIKKCLLDGITKGITYRTKVTKEAIEKELEKIKPIEA